MRFSNVSFQVSLLQEDKVASGAAVVAGRGYPALAAGQVELKGSDAAAATANSGRATDVEG